MKKSANAAVIAITIVFGGTSLLIESIGWIGIGIIGCGGTALWLYLKRSAARSLLKTYKSDEFGPIFPSPKEASSCFRKLMNHDPALSMRLRDQQILRESLYIAISSKTNDIAESRIQLARKTLDTIKTDYSIPADELSRLDAKCQEMFYAYPTARCINEAQRHIDRIASVKTAKTQKKYADMARQVVLKGLEDKATDHQKLRTFLESLPTY